MKALKIILCGLGIIIGTALTIGLAFLDRGPETYVYQARHIPNRYLKQIHKMELYWEFFGDPMHGGYMIGI